MSGEGEINLLDLTDDIKMLFLKHLIEQYIDTIPFHLTCKNLYNLRISEQYIKYMKERYMLNPRWLDKSRYPFDYWSISFTKYMIKLTKHTKDINVRKDILETYSSEMLISFKDSFDVTQYFAETLFLFEVKDLVDLKCIYVGHMDPCKVKSLIRIIFRNDDIKALQNMSHMSNLSIRSYIIDELEYISGPRIGEYIFDFYECLTLDKVQKLFRSNIPEIILEDLFEHNKWSFSILLMNMNDITDDSLEFTKLLKLKNLKYLIGDNDIDNEVKYSNNLSSRLLKRLER